MYILTGNIHTMGLWDCPPLFQVQRGIYTKEKWITSALSTFRVRAFKAVPIENFLRWDGKWFTMACDQAYILPILWHLRERDGDYRAVKFIDEPLYVYQFLQNPSKLRHGKENQERAGDAAYSAQFLRGRGFVNGT